MRFQVWLLALSATHSALSDDTNIERFNLTRPSRLESTRASEGRPTRVLNKTEALAAEEHELLNIATRPEKTTSTDNALQTPTSKADSNHDPSVQHHGVEASRNHKSPHKRNGTEEEENKEALTLRKMDPVGVATMFVVGLITSSLNIVSCGYLLYLVWTLSFRVGFHSSLRLLAYSTLFDMLVGSFFTLSIVYSTLFDSLITGVGCQAIGFVINMLTASDMLLIGFVAVSTYFKVVRNYDISRGRFDCWLLLLVVGVPLIASAVVANFHAFGPEALWCLIDDDTLAGKISTICTVSLYFVVMLIVFICYALVVQRKPSSTNVISFDDITTKSHNYSSNFDSLAVPSKEKEIRNRYYRKSVLSLGYAELKLESHLIIHFFQYTPPTLHMLAMLSGYRSAWVFTLAILSTNLGGLFQLWSYLHHQKKKRSSFKAFYQPPNTSCPPSPATLNFGFPPHPLTPKQPNSAPPSQTTLPANHSATPPLRWTTPRQNHPASTTTHQPTK
ncbi:hypothetical protein DSO57_1000090 [Entomophthora muscae]|uniref:Uncharacterized protein n=1 Tax=Entomophthora muscae TaxID=34485 RepID=A0ACC2SMB6_9FUNG|nr:hypothetical protein DSO57_1000090 [Entomophthora muscae]